DAPQPHADSGSRRRQGMERSDRRAVHLVDVRPKRSVTPAEDSLTMHPRPNQTRRVAHLSTEPAGQTRGGKSASRGVQTKPRSSAVSRPRWPDLNCASIAIPGKFIGTELLSGYW